MWLNSKNYIASQCYVGGLWLPATARCAPNAAAGAGRVPGGAGARATPPRAPPRAPRPGMSKLHADTRRNQLGWFKHGLNFVIRTICHLTGTTLRLLASHGFYAVFN